MDRNTSWKMRLSGHFALLKPCPWVWLSTGIGQWMRFSVAWLQWGIPVTDDHSFAMKFCLSVCNIFFMSLMKTNTVFLNDCFSLWQGIFPVTMRRLTSCILVMDTLHERILNTECRWAFSKMFYRGSSDVKVGSWRGRVTWEHLIRI